MKWRSLALVAFLCAAGPSVWSQALTSAPRTPGSASEASRLAIVTTNSAACGPNVFTNLQDALNWVAAVPANELRRPDKTSTVWNTNGGVGGVVQIEAGEYYCPTGFCIPQLGGGSIRITGRGPHVTRLSGDSNVLACASAPQPMWQSIELDHLACMARRLDVSAAVLDLGTQFQTAHVHDNWIGRTLLLPAGEAGQAGAAAGRREPGFYGWGESPIVGHPSRLIGLFCGGSDIVRVDGNIFWGLGAGVVFQGDHLRARDNAYDAIRSGGFDAKQMHPVCTVPEWALSFGACVVLYDGGDVILSGEHYFESDAGVLRLRNDNLYGEPEVTDALFESVTLCLLAYSNAVYSVRDAKALEAQLEPTWQVSPPCGGQAAAVSPGAPGISRLSCDSSGLSYWTGGTNVFKASAAGVDWASRPGGGRSSGTNLTVSLAAGGTATLHITNGVTSVTIP